MAKAKSTFQSLYEPYAGENAESLFRCYLNDKSAIIMIDDKTYYRALHIFLLNTGKTRLIAFLDNRLKLKIGDIIMDDNDNPFSVKGFAMIRFICDIPDWYTKASFVELSGDYKNIGHYFTKL